MPSLNSLENTKQGRGCLGEVGYLGLLLTTKNANEPIFFAFLVGCQVTDVVGAEIPDKAISLYFKI